MNNKISCDMVTLEADNLQIAAKLSCKAIDVVNSFDGKVLNIRFSRALSEALSVSVDVENDNYGFNISIRCKEDCKSFKKSPNDDIGYAYYVIHRDISICRVINTNIPNDGDKCIVGKRINAKAIVAGIKSKQNELFEKSCSLRKSLDSIQAQIERIEELKAKLRSVYNEIPYEVKEWFKIKELH